MVKSPRLNYTWSLGRAFEDLVGEILPSYGLADIHKKATRRDDGRSLRIIDFLCRLDDRLVGVECKYNSSASMLENNLHQYKAYRDLFKLDDLWVVSNNPKILDGLDSNLAKPILVPVANFDLKKRIGITDANAEEVLLLPREFEEKSLNDNYRKLFEGKVSQGTRLQLLKICMNGAESELARACRIIHPP